MITLEAANVYFENRLHADAWTSASNADRTKSLTMAERMIRATFDFVEGVIPEEESGLAGYASFVIYGICEQALYLLELDPTKYPELLTLGIASANAGAGAVFDRSMVAPFISPTAIRMIGSLGTFDDKANNTGKIASLSLGHGG